MMFVLADPHSNVNMKLRFDVVLILPSTFYPLQLSINKALKLLLSDQDGCNEGHYFRNVTVLPQVLPYQTYCIA